MDNSQKGIEAKLAALVAKRNAARRERRPELTPAQIEAQKNDEPTDGQLNQLRQFKVPEADIAEMTKYDASQTLDAIFAEIKKRNDAPISKKLLAALKAWGFEAEDVKDLTQGQGRDLLRQVAPPMKRDETTTYVSKNPIYKAVKKAQRG